MFRSREKAVENAEFGSMQKSGGKKQNITHLLDWWDTPTRPHQRQSYHENKRAQVTAKYSKKQAIYAKLVELIVLDFSAEQHCILNRDWI